MCKGARKSLKNVAGAGGFEPPYGGIKIRCLTAWLRPKNRVGKKWHVPPCPLDHSDGGRIDQCSSRGKRLGSLRASPTSALHRRPADASVHDRARCCRRYDRGGWIIATAARMRGDPRDPCPAKSPGSFTGDARLPQDAGARREGRFRRRVGPRAAWRGGHAEAPSVQVSLRSALRNAPQRSTTAALPSPCSGLD